MENFIAKTSKGVEYQCRFTEMHVGSSVAGPNGSNMKTAEVNVDGTWYRCIATTCRKDREFVPAIKLGADCLKHFGLKSSAEMYILLTDEWIPLYNRILEENQIKWKETANNAVFGKIRFSWSTSYDWSSVIGWDSELDQSYVQFNDKIRSMMEQIKKLDHKMLSEYMTEEDRGDYSITYNYEMTVGQYDSFMKKYEEDVNAADKEISDRKAKAEAKENAKKIREENIANGAVYFSCESAPHNDDLSNVILTRPCPNEGTFTITHRIPSDLFARIRKFGTYYSKDTLEEFDMFFSLPGWRFSSKAIIELSKDRDVYIDNEKVQS